MFNTLIISKELVPASTSLEGVAAGDFDDLAGEHPGLIAGQKENRFGDVLGLD